MRSTLAQAIRAARRASGLTQHQLGLRLGLKGRAIYRWERDDSAPRRARQAALVTIIHGVNPPAAAALAAVFARHSKQGRAAAATAAAASAPPAAPPPVDTKQVFALALFALADELDVPARRVRTALAQSLRRWREANITAEMAEHYLQAWRDAPLEI